MKKILVTGGAGFIGSNFIKYMLKKYTNIFIINLDSLTYAGNLLNLKTVENNSNYLFIKEDICNVGAVQEVFDRHSIEVVIHFAAESHVDNSIEQPNIFIKTNVGGTLNLLNVAKDYWPERFSDYKKKCRFVQISTDEVYGSLGETGLFTENDNIKPNSPYSASKASAGLLARAYSKTYGLPVNITCCSNNYGPFQFGEKLIPLVINKALKHENIPIYGDGLNVRDWMYVEDHCSAIDAVLYKGKVNETYNIGNNNEWSNIKLVRFILDYLQKNYDAKIGDHLIEYVADRKGHDRRYAVDSSKIKNELGWQAKTEFKEGLQFTIDWYVKNLS